MDDGNRPIVPDRLHKGDMGESIVEDTIPVLVVGVSEENQVSGRWDTRGKNPPPRLRIAVERRDAIVPAVGGALQWNADRGVDAFHQPRAVVREALSGPTYGSPAKEPSCECDRLLAGICRRGMLGANRR